MNYTPKYHLQQSPENNQVAHNLAFGVSLFFSSPIDQEYLNQQTTEWSDFSLKETSTEKTED